MQRKKPDKKTDSELWILFTTRISAGNYVFLKHAQQRLQDREINDIDILGILEDKNNRKRKRNKSKDIYIPDHQDWNYCIEGNDLDGRKIRIIISFNDKLMLIITVIRINE